MKHALVSIVLPLGIKSMLAWAGLAVLAPPVSTPGVDPELSEAVDATSEQRTWEQDMYLHWLRWQADASQNATWLHLMTMPHR